MGTGKRRSNGQLIRDRRRIADLYLRGWLQVDIAAEVGLSQSTVCQDLKALHKQWVASALVDIDIAKSKELAKIDVLERENWDAWQRSCEGAKTKTGNPRFLQGIERCIERRCKILGLDAPRKQEVIGFGGFAVNYSWDEMLEKVYGGTDTAEEEEG